MGADDGGSQQQFKRELSQLIRKYSAGLQTSDFADVLGEFHHDLAQGSLHPTVRVRGQAEPYTLVVTYSTAMALERDLDGYLNVGGVCLPVERDLPPLADVLVKVCATLVEASVTLGGRVIQTTPEGVAFQLTPPEGPIAESLAAMPDQMRAAAAAQRRVLVRAAQASAGQASAAPTAAGEVVGGAAGRPAAARRTKASAGAPIELTGRPKRSWMLSQTAFASILCELLDHQGMGVLDVEFGARRAQIVLEDAQVVDVEIYPRVEHEALASLLVAAGKLDAADIDRARAHAQRHGIAIAEALVELGILTYSQMGVALKTRARFLLGVLWKCQTGRASLYRVESLDRRFRTPRSPLVYHVFRRLRDQLANADNAWFAERRTFFQAHLLSRAKPPRCALADLELRQKERRLLEVVLDTRRPLSEVLRIAQLGEQETLMLLECWRQLELVALEEVNPWTRQRTKFVEQLARMRARLGAQDSFEVLGVHWTAYDEEIEEAYVERTHSLSDEELPDGLSDADRAMVAELREALEEAHALLSDRSRRASYRDELVGTFEKKAALEMFVKQADTAKLRRDLPAAIDAYKRVLEIKPGHPQARRDLEVLEKLRAAEQSSMS